MEKQSRMNAGEIKNEIRKLSPVDKIEIYRWIDVYRWIDEEAAVDLLIVGMSAAETSHDLDGMKSGMRTAGKAVTFDLGASDYV
jgi:hypothetical protein